MRKMRLLLLFMGGLGLAQQAKAQIDDAVARPIEKLLAAHVEVVNQSDCHVDDESFVAFLKLRLQLINSSDHPVILSRKIEPPPVVRAAGDLQSGEKGEFIFAPEAHFTVARLPKGSSAFMSGASPNGWLQNRNLKTVVPAEVFGANDAPKSYGFLAKAAACSKLAFT